MDYMSELEEIARKNGFKVSQNGEKVARYREIADIPLFRCPCEIRNRLRGCQLKRGKKMKKKCYNEILEKGRCKCGTFYKV